MVSEHPKSLDVLHTISFEPRPFQCIPYSFHELVRFLSMRSSANCLGGLLTPTVSVFSILNQPLSSVFTARKDGVQGHAKAPEVQRTSRGRGKRSKAIASASWMDVEVNVQKDVEQ